MSGVLVKVSSTDFHATDFLGYEIYGNIGDISGSDATVISAASFNAFFEGNTFPHVGLTPGDIWYHWVRGVYGNWSSPTYSALVKFGPTTAPPNNGEATAPAILGRSTSGTGPVEILATTAWVLSTLLAVTGVAGLKTLLGAGSASGLATLDSGGLIPVAQLPAIAITDSFPVASQAAMLALTAEKGDLAIRSDLNKSFVLSTNSPSTLADWLELKTPTDAVLSVAGLTGSITAAALKTALAIASGDVSGLGSLATLSAVTASLISDASANGRSLITAANYDAMRGLLGDQCFSAYKSSATNNATGDGTVYYVVFDTVDAQTSGYNGTTGAFTAATDGYYHFSVGVLVGQLGSGHTDSELDIERSDGAAWRLDYANPYVQSAGSYTSLNGSRIVYMTAGQTMKVRVQVGGPTKTVQVFGNGARDTGFSGARVA